MVSQGRQHAALTRPNPSDARTTFAAATAASTTAKYQYVWDQRYIDSPVLRDEDLDSDGDCTDDEPAGSERLCYANDANFNVTALVETDGTVAERTIYDAYGQPTLYDATWSNTIAESASKANEIRFCGYVYDAAVGLYTVRYRVYHPTLGRWAQRDPAGYVDVMSLYSYVGGRCISYLDPFGLEEVFAEVVHTYVINDSDMHERREEDQTDYLGEITVTWTVTYDDDNGTIVSIVRRAGQSNEETLEDDVTVKGSAQAILSETNKSAVMNSAIVVASPDVNKEVYEEVLRWVKVSVGGSGGKDKESNHEYEWKLSLPPTGDNPIDRRDIFTVSQGTTLRVVKTESGKCILKAGKGTTANPYPSKEKPRNNIGGGIHTPDVFVEANQKVALMEEETVR